MRWRCAESVGVIRWCRDKLSKKYELACKSHSFNGLKCNLVRQLAASLPSHRRNRVNREQRAYSKIESLSARCSVSLWPAFFPLLETYGLPSRFPARMPSRMPARNPSPSHYAQAVSRLRFILNRLLDAGPGLPIPYPETETCSQ